MVNDIVITIDGPAGSGKSSIARLFEERLSFNSINSGAFYRCTAFLFCHFVSDTDLDILSQTKDIQVHLSHLHTIINMYVPAMQWKNHTMQFLHPIQIKEKTYTSVSHDELFSQKIDTYASLLSTYTALRQAINTHIRYYLKAGKWIIEGRDAGTHIFPDTKWKFYLDADINTRIQRRVHQYSGATKTQNNDTVAQALVKRDALDKNKGEYSLKSNNSELFYIDSTDKTLEQIYEIMYTNIVLSMSEQKINNTTNPVEVDVPANFDQMIDNSFQRLHDVQNIHHGDIVNGEIIKVTDSDVFLDLGLKTEGRISITEFENAHVVPTVGDSIQVFVMKNNTDNLNVSFAKAQELQSINELRESYQNNKMVKATVKSVHAHGFIAQIASSVQAFVPISQMDTFHISEQHAHKYVNNEYEFLILELYRNKKLQPILSRKKLLVERYENAKNEFISQHKEGDVVKGTVKTFTSFGVFIDLGGFDALLHISDISWKHSVRPTEALKKNEEHEFKLISINAETKKIGLSLKALQPDPWDSIQTNYPVGTIVPGKVMKVLSYGAFISIDQEIEGFIHISEMSWLKHIKHPSELLKQGSIVKCKVLHIDNEKKRISLGLKQAERNPWETVDSLYPVGYKLQLPIKRVTPQGIVVEFEEGYRGVIDSENISWSKQRHNYKQGQKVECIVLSHDKENCHINLGIKQLSENPWESDFLGVGRSVEGVISSVTDFGVFVRFPNGVEGLIPKNKTFDTKEHSSYEDVRPKFKVGKPIQAVIVSIQKNEQRLLLSVQALKEMIDQQELEKHMVNDVESERAMSLGDIIVSDKNS